MPDLHHHGPSPELGAWCGQAHGLDPQDTWHELHSDADVLLGIAEQGVPTCTRCLKSARALSTSGNTVEHVASVERFVATKPPLSAGLKIRIGQILGEALEEHRTQQEQRASRTHRPDVVQHGDRWYWRCTCGVARRGSSGGSQCERSIAQHREEVLARILAEEM